MFIDLRPRPLDPFRAIEDPVFLVNNPATLDAIGYPDPDRGRYSYIDLFPTLALLNALQRVAGLRLELSTLEKEAADFDARVSELITADPDLAAYVRELKRRVFSS